VSDPRYIAAGDHAFTVASGATFAPGDQIPAAAIDIKNDHDKHLLSDGQIIDTKEQSR
jgi:hypothetical protein